jgi:hypothetical protein
MFPNSVVYKGQIRERVYFHLYELCWFSSSQKLIHIYSKGAGGGGVIQKGYEMGEFLLTLTLKKEV